MESCSQDSLTPGCRIFEFSLTIKEVPKGRNDIWYNYLSHEMIFYYIAINNFNFAIKRGI